VDLAHLRHALRRRERALAESRLVLLGLDVDDDVALRQRLVKGGLDGVSRGVALADRGARRDADDDIGELASSQPGACANRRNSTGGSSAAIAREAISCASEGTRSIRTSMFRRISLAAAARTSTATKSAAAESASCQTGPNEQQTYEHRD
jgi:hypothetical protein